MLRVVETSLVAVVAAAQPVVNQYDSQPGGDPVADEQQKLLVLALIPLSFQVQAARISDDAGDDRQQRAALPQGESHLADSERDQRHRAAVDVDSVGRDGTD